MRAPGTCGDPFHDAPFRQPSPEPTGVKSAADYDMQLVEGLIKRLASAERERDGWIDTYNTNTKFLAEANAELERENQALRELVNEVLGWEGTSTPCLDHKCGHKLCSWQRRAAALAQPSAAKDAESEKGTPK